MRTVVFQATVSDETDLTGIGDELRQVVEHRALVWHSDGFIVTHADDEDVDVHHRTYPKGVYR